ncbi:GAF domain-containing protein [Xylophilus rhododendri]|uniref:histidine kinase n=1 Tax=Xylophilus rhododendri TaxID=2697032 RepID=A0A857J3U5_9BURK|nr:GAF domain-containing protein [Xylophilus rhododendri]QHI97548.1 GAF domain-containing protein [Xylophilus rhododendri]
MSTDSFLEPGTPPAPSAAPGALPVPDAAVATDRAEAYQQALLALGDALREVQTEAEIVLAAARICAQAIGASRGGYGAIGTLATHVRVAADWRRDASVPSVAGDYCFADFGSFIEDLRAGAVVAIDDIRLDPRTSGQADAFDHMQIKALLNVPLMREGRLAGVFLAHDSVRRAWSREEIAFVRAVADRTWAAIATAEALAELRGLNVGLEKEVALRTADRNHLWQLSRDVLLVARFDGEIVAVNPAWEATLGWTERELLGRSFMDLVHPDDLAHTADGAQALAGGTAFSAFENRYRHRDGSYRWLSWSASPAESFIIASGRDVTDQKAQESSLRQAEEQLRQSQKMEAVGQLTGGIAHDFNNLLTIISSSVQLMQRPGLAEERRQRFLGSISNAVSRAAKLTGQLLAFARRQSLQPVVFDAGGNIAAIADMVQTLVGSRVQLQLQHHDDACLIDADPGQFDTAIVNMAANARDAMDGVGTLSIEIRRVDTLPALRGHSALGGDFIAVSVRDSGCGIAPDRLEKVFEPFYTTKPVGHGTGLGLSQVFGFAKQSGGDVGVQSEPGRGTCFTVFLPAARRAKAQVSAPQDAMDGATHCGRILVVEDNREVALMARDALSELGYEVTLVHGSEQALALMEANGGEFRAMFSDVMMAGMDGLALARKVRQAWPQLPILLCSGYNEVLVRSEGHQFPLLPKPYDLEALAEALKAAIRMVQPRAPTASGLHAAQDAREADRLADLDQLQVIDTPAELAYDEIAQLAAAMFDAPMALISLVDGERQWFKARVGVGLQQTPREYAFCATAIQQPDEVMVVNDALQDPAFASNPLVTDGPRIRFYAGAPLVTSTGHAIGTVCVLDTEPRPTDHGRVEALKLLARQVVERLEKKRLKLM